MTRGVRGLVGDRSTAEAVGPRGARFSCGGLAIFPSTANNQSGHPRLLIIEPDAAIVAHLLAIFQRSCFGAQGRRINDRGMNDDGSECCHAIDSLAQLRAMNLDHSEVVICAASLRDGSGMDALTYIRESRPELPVIITSSSSAMAIEAIRGGALDFLEAAQLDDFNTLPLMVEKCLIHQRINLDKERLQSDLKKSLAELSGTNEQLQTVIRQLEAMARTDELTGLSNRRWFNLMLEGYWADATRNDQPLACLMIDLDEFKAVNDKLGHHHGDDLLRLAARVLRANCREIDVPSRYGGDEFCVLMSHTEAHEAIMVAERILHEFDQVMRQRPANEPPVGMSIGLAHVDLSRPVNGEQLVSHADQAMYAAKSAGKRRLMVRYADGVKIPTRIMSGNRIARLDRAG